MCHGRLPIHNLTPSPCWPLPRSFHGIQPSKNTRERRAQKAAEEIAKKRAASEAGSSAPAGSLQQMKQVQKQAATPYVVLSGTIKPGQSRDAASGARVGAHTLPMKAPAVALAAALRRAAPRPALPCPAALRPPAFSLSMRMRLAPSPAAGYATVDRAEALTAPTPVLGKLGGGTTPLVGNAKVGAGCRGGPGVAAAAARDGRL